MKTDKRNRQCCHRQWFAIWRVLVVLPLASGIALLAQADLAAAPEPGVPLMLRDVSVPDTAGSEASASGKSEERGVSPNSAEQHGNLPALGCILEPSTKVQISSAVAGVLKHVPVKRGDVVKKGEVLFELGDGVQAAAVDLAKVKADFTRRKQERNQDLYTDDLLSPHERDEIETEMRSAEAELRLKREELSLRKVTSPVNGVVTDRFYSPGEYVAVEPVMTLATLDPLHIDVLLPADYFGQIRKGSDLLVRPDAPVGGEYRARVSIVDPLVDPASGTFRLQLVLKNPEHRLPAGIRCSVARP